MAGAVTNSRSWSRGVEAWQPSQRHIDAVCDVARAFGVDPFSPFGRGRRREIAHARKVAYLVLRESYGLSYTQTAKLFGNRDHSTIIHGIASAIALAKRSPELAALIERLKSRGPVVRHNAHVLAWLDHNHRKLRARDERAVKRAEDAAIAPPAPPPRVSKPVNALDPDDHDARKRASGAMALSAAIEAAGGWPANRR